MPNPLDELRVHLWVLAALGRLARQGLLDDAAPADDALAVASQRLLIEAGWLDSEPVRPSPILREVIPPGLPLRTPGPYVADLLNPVHRSVDGASPGWSQA